MKKNLFVSAALFAFFFPLYRIFPDAFHNFDGLMFSSTISQELAGWRQEIFMYASHFLFNPTGWLFHRILSAFGYHGRGFVTIGILNALLAALTIALFFLLLMSITRELFSASALSALLGFSYIFWSRAVECSVYMPALFWVAVALCFLWAYDQTGKKRMMAGMVLSVSLASLYHLSYVVCFPALLFFVWMKNKKHFLTALILLSLMSALPHVLTYRISSLHALHEWFLRQGTGAAAYWGWNSAAMSFRYSLHDHARALAQIFWVWPPHIHDPLSYLPLGLALVSGLLLAVSFRSSMLDGFKRYKAIGAFSVLFIFGILLLQSFWQYELNKYSAIIFIVVLWMALSVRVYLGKHAGLTKLHKAGLICLCAGTFVYNLWGGIIPDSRLENNIVFQQAALIRQQTEPESYVVIGGSFLKHYLPGFFSRNRLSLDLYFSFYPKQEASAKLKTDLETLAQGGVPIYVLSDILRKGFAEESPKAWQLTQEDITAIFTGFDLVKIAQISPGMDILRLWPKSVPDKVWMDYAVRSIENQHWQEAVYSLERLHAGHPALTVFQNLAQCYAKLGQPDKSAAVFTEGLRRFPGDPALVYGLAESMYSKNHREAAQELMRRHLGADASSPLIRQLDDEFSSARLAPGPAHE